MTFSSIVTLVKDDGTPWGITKVRDQGNFTDEQYETIIKPYWDFLESQFGFISYTITVPQPNTKVHTLVCDSEEDAKHINSLITRGGAAEPHPIANAYINLVSVSNSNVTKTWTVANTA